MTECDKRNGLISSKYYMICISSNNLYICIKTLKWSRYRPGVAQSVGRVILYSSMTAALEGVRGQQHAPAAIFHRERNGTYFTGGWVGPRAGPEGRKISSPTGIDSGPPTRSQSLYRLSYTARLYIYILTNNDRHHVTKTFNPNH